MSIETISRHGKPYLILLVGWILLAAYIPAANLLCEIGVIPHDTVQERAFLGMVWTVCVAYATALLFVRRMLRAGVSRRAERVHGNLGIGITVVSAVAAIVVAGMGV